MGKDVKWALDIAVTALVLVAVPAARAGRPGAGTVEDEGARPRPKPPLEGAVRFLSGRAEMLLSR